MAIIKDVLYVRFRVTDLQAQQRFLDDFGFQTSIDDLLLARGAPTAAHTSTLLRSPASLHLLA